MLKPSGMQHVMKPECVTNSVTLEETYDNRTLPSKMFLCGKKKKFKSFSGVSVSTWDKKVHHVLLQELAGDRIVTQIPTCLQMGRLGQEQKCVYR